ncbi:MAG: LysR substrate-binding domain-containing protein [Nocardioidaceae bacterium]
MVPPLLGLHAFEAAARHLSFAAAAAELHLSASAVSQRVRTLEAHLGVRLFERQARSLRLTELGEAYLPAVRDLFQDLSAATSGLFGSSGRTRLTVRVQVSYAVTWLSPRLPQFLAAFPHVDVRLVSAIWADALPPSQIDLEIRQGNGTWVGFVATRLHEDHAVAVYGPGHAGRYGTPAGIAELRDRDRVHVLGLEDLWRRFYPASEDGPVAPPYALTVDTTAAALEVVAAGDCWALVPERFARSAVGAGRVAVVGPAVRMRQDHYLLRREDPAPLSGQASAFARWLQEQDRTDPTLGSAPG